MYTKQTCHGVLYVWEGSVSGLLATGIICGLTTKYVVVVSTVAGSTQNMFFDNRLTSYV